MKAGAVLVSLSAAAAHCLVAGSTPEIQVSLVDAVTSLVEAERAFVRMSIDRGLRAAFLEYLAEGSIVFRPAPVEGRPVYEKMAPDNPTLLTWEPEVAEISASGDLGFTSGPYWVFKSRDEGEPSGHGHYVSVWRRGPDGEWKVALDIGIEHEAPASAPGDAVRLDFPTAGPFPRPEGPDAARDLIDADLEFTRKAGLWGYLVSLKETGTEDVRVYRPASLPASGRDRIQDVIALGLGRTTTEVAGAGIAVSGDLGYTYGTFTITGISGESAASSYLKIWRRHPTKGWLIALDIALPLNPS